MAAAILLPDLTYTAQQMNGTEFSYPGPGEKERDDHLDAYIKKENVTG